MQDLNKLLKILLDSKLDFILVGGYAATLHGASQVTQDIDICAVISKENLQLLRSTLKDFNPKLRMNPNFQPSFLDHPRTDKKIHNLYLKTDIGILDIMDELQPVGDFAAINKKAISVSLFGNDCKVICLEDLISIKKDMKRDKDILVLKELELARNLKK